MAKGATVIVSLLLANTDIVDLVDDRVIPLFIEQEIILPSITYQLVSVDPNATKDGSSTLDVERYQINVFSDSFDEANELADLVRSTLDFYTGFAAGLEVQRIWFESSYSNFSDPSKLTGVYQLGADYHIRINPNQTIQSALELTFDDIANVPVNNANSLSDWNTFFDLPNFGTAFTSVSVYGNTIILGGGGDIALKDELFQNNNYLLSIIDNNGVITEILDTVFSECLNLHTIISNSVVSVGRYGVSINPSLTNLQLHSLTYATEDGGVAFNTNVSVYRFPELLECGFSFMASLIGISSTPTGIYIPKCTNLGGTVGYNQVFRYIIGQTITLTIPSALMTCNGGQPDGDIQYLQANNTVTIITV